MSTPDGGDAGQRAPQGGARISRTIANVAGLLAIASWGSLGVLGQKASSLPPFFVLAVCFGLAAAVGMMALVPASWRGLMSVAIDRGGVAIAALFMFGYHALYFTAFHHAPAVEVTLLNYLWPAFVILVGNLAFGLGAGARGFAAAGLGFGGVALLLGFAPHVEQGSRRPMGLAMALGAAFVWGIYCNLRRTARGNAVADVTAICAIGAVLAAAVSAIGEARPSPDASQIAVLLALAAGPAGGAFFLWDVAMRHGNAAALAVLSYAAPLMSTGLLVAAGIAEPSWRIAGAALLIAAAGVIGFERERRS